MLKKTVESGCALGFGQNFEPCRNDIRINERGDEEGVDLHCSMALSSSLKLTSREAAAISSYMRGNRTSKKRVDKINWW